MFIEYFDNGINVIPLVGKRPIIKGWQKYCVKEIPEMVVEEWEARYKNKNIGLPLGEFNKIIALDIDSDDLKVLNEAPKSPLVKKGKKGETRFFYYNGEKASKNLSVGYELLSSGNQTVIPPSIHPESKKPYVWIGPKLLGFNLDNLPILDPEFIDKFFTDKVVITNIRPSDGSRCNHGSHNKLSAMMVAAIHDNATPQEIVEYLINYDEKINEKVSYFLCTTRRWKSNDKILNAFSFVLDGFKRNKEINLYPTKVEIIEKPKEEIKRIRLNHWRGIGKELFELGYESSRIKRSRFLFASVTNILGVLASNMYSFDETYTNFYNVIIGASGAGKDAPLRFVQKVLVELNKSDLIGKGNPQSVQALINGLDVVRDRIDLYDEFNSMIEGITKKNANSNYMAITGELNKLYTSTGNLYLGLESVTSNNGKPRGRCMSPCLSLLGAMTDEGFKNAFNYKIIKEGIGGRFTYFPDLRVKKSNVRLRSKKFVLPENVKAFSAIIRSKINIPDTDINNKIIAQELDFNSPKTENYYFDILEDLDKQRINSMNSDSKKSLIVNRQIELFKKYIILDVLSTQLLENDGRFLSIKKENLDWSIAVTRQLTDIGASFFEKNLFDNNVQFLQDSVISILRDHSLNYISQKELFNKLRNRISTSTIKDWKITIETLLESDIIVKVKALKSNKKVGRPEICYSLK